MSGCSRLFQAYCRIVKKRNEAATQRWLGAQSHFFFSSICLDHHVLYAGPEVRQPNDAEELRNDGIMTAVEGDAFTRAMLHWHIKHFNRAQELNPSCCVKLSKNSIRAIMGRPPVRQARIYHGAFSGGG